MSDLDFQAFHPGLDPVRTVMIDGYAPGFRMISHWPGHGTPEPLRHDLTTGSAFLYAEMSEARRKEVIGDFSIVTNNHYDADGTLSLFTMLRPETALRHKNLILRTARAGDFAVWGGEDALALELSIMSDLEPFMPLSTPPFDDERLGNLARAYLRIFDRMEALLTDPFALRDQWSRRYDRVTADVARVDAGDGITVTRYPQDDLAVVETDRPITNYGLRRAADDLFRVLLVHPADGGNRYRFCFRGESWWDVVSVRPQPRKPLDRLAARLNELEENDTARWWATPLGWPVPELGFGDPVTFQNQSVRIDPLTKHDSPSSLPLDLVLEEVRHALQTGEAFQPVAVKVDAAKAGE